MKEPRRLISEDPVSAAMLGAARAYRPSAEARRRTMKMLGVPIAVSVAMSAPAVVASSLTMTVKTWIAVCAVGATVAGGGGVVAYRAAVRHRAAPHVQAVAHVFAHKRALSQEPTTAPQPAVEPVVLPAPGVVPESVVPVTVRAVRPPARRTAAMEATAPPPVVIAAVSPPPLTPLPVTPTRVVPIDSTSARRAPLAPEVALLDEAQTAFVRQDHRSALGRVDEYVRKFPDGALLEEALVLKIAALMGSGDRGRAEDLGTMFLNHYQNSVLSGRVKSMLAQMNEQKNGGRHEH